MGTKSEVFSSRRQSVNHSKGISKFEVIKGLDTDRNHDSGKKSDYFYSNKKSYTA